MKITAPRETLAKPEKNDEGARHVISFFAWYFDKWLQRDK